MLQNTVGDVTDLANVKQLGDQIIARGGPSLDFEGYIELLLSACSTYDKNHATPNKSGPRNVYTTDITHDAMVEEANYDVHSTEVFHVDTDISDIVAHATDIQRKGNSSFLPREEWLKLSPEKREELIAKRRKERALQNGYNQQKNSTARRVNLHDVQDVHDVVNLDDIIEYTANTHTLDNVYMTGDDGVQLVVIHYLLTWQDVHQAVVLPLAIFARC
jgi:hypothetical protein